MTGLTSISTIEFTEATTGRDRRDHEEMNPVPGPVADRVKNLIDQLFGGIAQRVDQELGLAERLEQEQLAEDRRYADATQERTSRYNRERDEVQAGFDRAIADAGMHYQAHYSVTSEEFDETLRAVNGEYDEQSETAKAEFEETRWMVVSYFDENAGGSPKQQFEQFEHNLEVTRDHLDTEGQELETVYNSTVELLTKRRMWTEPELPQPSKPKSTVEEIVEDFTQVGEAARKHADSIRRSALPLLFTGLMPLLTFVVLTGGIAGIAWLVVDPAWMRFRSPPTLVEWLGILSALSSLVTMATMGILFGVARAGSENRFLQLAESVVNARTNASQWTKLTNRELRKRQQEFDDWYGKLVDERDSRLRKAQEKLDRSMAECEQKKRAGLQQANQRYPALLEALTRERDEKVQLAQDEFPGRLEKLEARYKWELDKLAQDHEKSLDEIRQRFEFDWQSMSREWHNVCDSVRTGASRYVADNGPISQSWTELAFGNWAPFDQIPNGVRLGDFILRLSDVEYGLPEDDRLVPEETEYVIPAMLPFPEKTSMLLTASGGEARQAAVDLLQVSMLRLLTTLPPGKIRFTIIDPIGLGENFSAFMHLADYDDLMVTSRIWTETTHIEQRLTDLTEHMETVFQTYLRNEFKTIEEYNEFAGEVAEPYHILVVAGFPSNFSEQAARRLTSIASSGPRCGVYTLMSVDPQLMMPPNFHLQSFSENATCLTWDDGAFRFEDENLAWLPLVVAEPPEPDEFSRIVKRVGDESKDARRVEVAFERVAPKAVWQNDSRTGLDVPLGRAGATKLQHMRLGRGTSQHVMIAGKTGSGKSTFMHILITNLALHYSPYEVEFYLIDFKKGVEFKTYAANRMPHARVIAIESDREFGLSVLHRLDGILKERGDLFRAHGVQDIASFRDANPDVRMPRLMLLIDEFQEFFTEDDKISQTSSLLLDRLVRQGRAFGMHVMLGSQTLGGAYSLARSTLGQVAVRIALQCSESDAHLILSEENTAARLLTRPGEAIYNDANGLLEGNHPFQIAWLDDDRRDHYLGRIRDVTDEQAIDVTAPIVFEGNVPANPGSNRDLVQLIDSAPAESVPRAVTLWLGEAVAIKPHTEIRLRRLSGSNVMMVGQDPVAARGILSTILLAVASQTPPLMPVDAVAVLDDEEADASDGESVIPPDDETADATDVAESMSDALEAMKSFSFADMKVPKPDLDEPASSPVTGSTNVAPAAQIYVLDGSLVDDLDEEFWQPLAERLPHDIRVGGPRESARFITEIAAEVERRGDSDSDPPIFLLIDNLGRCRDLRRSDDDYGFGSRDREVTPAQLFVEILKKGPSVGVHTIVWADTFNNASRWMTSSTMRELELRVAFQMSATDSSNYIDSPAASKLGQNRALLFLEEHGSHEKFRPYGLPSDEWLARVAPQPSSQTEEPIETADDLSSWTIL